MLVFTETKNELKREAYDLCRAESVTHDRVMLHVASNRNQTLGAFVLSRDDCIAIAKAAGWPTPRQDKRR